MSDKLLLPTGKPHISFSEISNWNACSYRHKLRYVDGIDLFEPSVYLDFGTAIHAACENFLKTRVMNVDIATEIIEKEWDAKNFFDKKKWLLIAENILKDIPAFFESTFPDWEYFSAEELLYENIEGHEGILFKGFIDGIIKVKDNKGNPKYWILDYKTCSWGWHKKKKQDFMVSSQLILYKNYWSQKQNIPFKDIRCGFVLLKRDGKNGNRCELFPVSVGPKTSKRALKVIDNMITSVKKGIALKNRNSCKWCEFYETEHCI
jgi:hypothetical protein